MLTNCGYKPIYNAEQDSFQISNVKFNGEKNINFIINNYLKTYKNVKSSKIKYQLKINSFKTINVSSRDSKGDPEFYNMIIGIDMEDIDRNTKKSFQKKFIYREQSNRFTLKQLEKNIEKDLVGKILEELTLFLKAN